MLFRRLHVRTALLLCLIAFFTQLVPGVRAQSPANSEKLFARDNLVAWCIVPFDAKKRGPEDRVAMLKKLGFTRYAYDWRAEHLPTFDRELQLLQANGIRLQAVWFPAQLDADARTILDLLRKHRIKTELWITMADPAPGKGQADKVAAAVKVLEPIAREAARLDCRVGLYNHGNWFGEPENELAILDALKFPNVGLVYNLHHGHDHLARFPAVLAKMLPHLYCLNLNGMTRKGDQDGMKILPLGTDDHDLTLLRTIRDSGYRGPLGILGHTQDDAEARLHDNLDGFDWLVARLNGNNSLPRPRPRTPVPPAAARPPLGSYRPEVVTKLVAEARSAGDARRGALVFRAATSACLSCHKLDGQGSTVGPDLSLIGKVSTPQEIVESFLWPKRQVKPEFVAHQVVTSDGRVIQGYKKHETDIELTLMEPGTDRLHRIPKSQIEERREIGTLMPENLDAAMTPAQRRDLVRFLMELGHTRGLASAGHGHAAASFQFDRAPLKPGNWPHWQHPVNRDRLYDFYAKEAEHFQHVHSVPHLLPEFPGLDGGKLGHWGNQNETSWADGRWNLTDLGSVMCGVFRGASVTVPKAVCIRLGDRGELAACFNPATLSYEGLWRGGFVRHSPVRHGFLDGLSMDGTALPRPAGGKPAQPFVYHGYYRHGRRVIFSYRLGDVEMLDAPWVENGQFTRQIAPADKHPLAHLIRGGPAQWPQTFEVRGKLGPGRPYAVDEIPLPVQNPWKALLFFGGHDILPDGTAILCTMQGDVWRVDGLDDSLTQVRWRRIASGLHHALGVVVDGPSIYVLGHDQITRLVDLNGDGETDFYECVTNAYDSSPAGHNFICGLERDREGQFYTVSGSQGLLQISPGSGRIEVLAKGIRNADGLALLPDGSITVPCSEGEWTPASMIGLVRRLPGQPPVHLGYGGPREGKPPALPLAYLPRGLDNSSGGQVVVPDERWGPLKGQVIHFSYGAGSHFLVLRDEVQGQVQGAIVPLAGEFLSGAHRGRFSPKDGQLYVSGMGGWGTYTPDDGCFQRVRYTGDPVQLPCAFHVHRNGILLRFTQPLDRAVAEEVRNHFAQCWNYRYSAAYGSPEFSPSHPGTPGHDPLTIASAHVTPDGHGLFLELPELQPVNQLHLYLGVGGAAKMDLFVTVHRLDAPYTQLPGYRAVDKVIAAHPILSDLALATKRVPNPWRTPIREAREIALQAGANLTFSTRSFHVKAGSVIKLTFTNPDVVPHNWVLIKPGQLERIGDLTNKLIADPEALARHYVPADSAVLAHTDIVAPQERNTIYFRAPAEPGRYPYLCTFPGHWMVMNGQMIVE
jgi:putative heme-binding domain-containing protein